MDLNANPVYDWNLERWRQVSGQLAQLPHALLLAGPAGLGKNAFAARLAAVLLCERPSPAGACGECKGCLLVAADTHPDLYRVAPAEDGKSILIDQVRALGEFLALRPHTARHKVVIVSPADAMNNFAANSLLKVLEEPPLGSYLILVTTQPAWLPATIRSRCSRLTFQRPAPGVASAWLQDQSVPPKIAKVLLALADGAPLAALAAHEQGFLDQRKALLADLDALAGGRTDPIPVAARWKKAGAGRGLGWLQGYIADLVRIKAAGAAARLVNPDLTSELQGRANGLNLNELLAFYALVSHNYALTGESLDELMLLEETLIAWLRLNRK